MNIWIVSGLIVLGAFFVLGLLWFVKNKREVPRKRTGEKA